MGLFLPLWNKLIDTFAFSMISERNYCSIQFPVSRFYVEISKWDQFTYNITEDNWTNKWDWSMMNSEMFVAQIYANSSDINSESEVMVNQVSANPKLSVYYPAFWETKNLLVVHQCNDTLICSASYKRKLTRNNKWETFRQVMRRSSKIVKKNSTKENWME